MKFFERGKGKRKERRKKGEEKGGMEERKEGRTNGVKMQQY